IIGPVLDLRGVNLNGSSAIAAHEMVVVTGRGALAKQRLAVVEGENVYQAVFNLGLQHSIHRGKQAGTASVSHGQMDLLSRLEVTAAIQHLVDGLLLPRVACARPRP